MQVKTCVSPHHFHPPSKQFFGGNKAERKGRNKEPGDKNGLRQNCWQKQHLSDCVLQILAAFVDVGVCDIRNIKGFPVELVQGNINQTHLFQEKKPLIYPKGELPLWKRYAVSSAALGEAEHSKCTCTPWSFPAHTCILSHKTVGRKISTSLSNLKVQVSFS